MYLSFIILLQNVLYDFSSAVTCMAVHPLSPHYVAIAVGDGSVMLLDRRKTGSALTEITPSSLVQDSTLHKFRPDGVGSQPRKITSVQFNPVGSELLVSYSEDYVYLFSSGLFGAGNTQSPAIPKPMNSYSPLICRKRSRSDAVRSKPPKTSNVADLLGIQSSSSNEEPPPVKRFRVRGDWSDTGPDARPEEELELQGRNRPSQNLMNRMSQMFAQWIDISLSPEENEGDERPRRNNVSASSSSSSNDSSFQQESEGASVFVQQGRTVADNLIGSNLTLCTDDANLVTSEATVETEKKEIDACNNCPAQKRAVRETVNVVEDETDSDDDNVVKKQNLQIHKKQNSQVQSFDTVKTIEQEVTDNLQPFMVYKGHRNSRTMVSILSCLVL